MFAYYSTILFFSIMAMIIMQICVTTSHTLTKHSKQLFYMLFNAIIIAAFCEWFGKYLQGTGESTRVIHIIAKAVEFSIAPCIAFFIAWVIEAKHQKIIICGLVMHAIIEWLSGIFGFVYYVDTNSNYVHGRCYWIYMAAYVISMIYFIYIALKNIQKYQYNGALCYCSIVAFMLTGIIVQMLNSKIMMVYATLTISVIMLYVITLEMIYQTDELTELLNRRGFENYSSHIETSCIIIFIDVDKFKEINDNYGHAYGDRALRVIGKLIKKQYGKFGKCFRYGGDEFCVLLTKQMEQVTLLNHQFSEAIMHACQKENTLPTVSIGYACYDPKNQNILDALEVADEMMYRVKKQRKIKE